MMKNNLQRYPISVFWSDEDEAYIAIAPDLEGCSAGGATAVAALQELQVAMSLWLEAARQIGKPFPEPSLPKEVWPSTKRWQPCRIVGDKVYSSNRVSKMTQG